MNHSPYTNAGHKEREDAIAQDEQRERAREKRGIPNAPQQEPKPAEDPK